MPPPTTNVTAQQLDELRRRYEQLNNQRIAAETRLGETRKALEELKKEAEAQWGTSDLKALQAKLAEQLAENERLRKDYETRLINIETGLKQIESQHSTKT